MPTPTEWDLSPLLASDTDPALDSLLSEVEAANLSFVTTWKERTDYLVDPIILRQALDEYEQLAARFGTSGQPGYYFGLRASQDQANPVVRAAENRVDELSTRLINELQFFENTLCRLPVETQNIFLTHPELSPYQHYLERLFSFSRHLLSDPEERIMNLKSKASHENWARLTSSLLSKEVREVPLPDGSTAAKGQSELNTLTHHTRKDIRDASAVALYDIANRHIDVAEAEFNSLLGDKKVSDELRAWERPESSRHMADDIHTTVVDALTQAVQKHFDTSRRFYILRAKLTGQPTLAYHERMVDLGSIEKTYTYEEASTLVQRVFTQLDPEFGAIYDRLTNNGQVDVYPKPGKRIGAFCASDLLSLPTYILLNYTGEPGDIRTIAHEFGHAINAELMREKRHALDFGTPLSTAEVASTFMEDFARAEMAKNATAEERLILNVSQLDDEISTIFRQVAAYRFEQELHARFREAGYLAKETISEIFTAHMKDYLGDAVTIDSGAENGWVSWSHFRTFFYVYSYASGLLISKALQRKVKTHPQFLEDVKTFLSAGLSQSPTVLFSNLGIDITKPTFWEEGLAETAALLEQTEALAMELGRV